MPSAWTASSCCWGGFDTIRDVIAFPKTGNGFDPLTQAPAPISAQQRREAGVDAKPAPKKDGASDKDGVPEEGAGADLDTSAE